MRALLAVLQALPQPVLPSQPEPRRFPMLRALQTHRYLPWPRTFPALRAWFPWKPDAVLAVRSRRSLPTNRRRRSDRPWEEHPDGRHSAPGAPALHRPFGKG